MEPETPPSTPVFESEPIRHDNWDGPWILASVPASEIESETSQWRREQSKGAVYIIGKYNDDVHEVIIDPVYLPGLKFRRLQFNLEYDPIQLEERQKAVYGTYHAAGKARDRWLQHAVDAIRSKPYREVEDAYHHSARLNGLHEALARAILVRDISVNLLL